MGDALNGEFQDDRLNDADVQLTAVEELDFEATFPFINSTDVEQTVSNAYLEDETKFTFDQADGNTVVIDTQGNEWTQYEDGYVAYYNAEDRQYVWLDETGTLVQIVDQTGDYWAVD